MSEDEEEIEYEETEDTEDTDYAPSGTVKQKTREPKKKTTARKLKHDWKHEEIVQLISLVEQRRALWDAGSPEYKLARLDSWREVIDALNVSAIDVDEAKLKWMNLRLGFKLNMKKLRKKSRVKVQMNRSKLHGSISTH